MTRSNEYKLIVSEFDLWGGSIKTDISRVLVENIATLLGIDNLAVIAWKTTMSESYRVPVIISQFDGIPGGSLSLKAQWAVLDKDGITYLSIVQIHYQYSLICLQVHYMTLGHQSFLAHSTCDL